MDCRCPAKCLGKVQLLALLDLTRRRMVLPLTMRGMIACLFDISSISIMGVMPRCLHCMTHCFAVSF